METKYKVSKALQSATRCCMSSLRTLITDTVRYCWNQRSRSQVIFLGKTFSNSGRFASLAELKRWLEREKRGGNEGKENADPRSGNMGEETTAKGEGVSGGGFRDCGSDIPPNGSTGSRQSLCCCRGCSRPRYLYSHLQAYEGEDLCRYVLLLHSPSNLFSFLSIFRSASVFFFPFIGFDFGFIFSFYRFRFRIIVLCFFSSYFNSYWERFCLFGCKKISRGKRERDNLLESHYFSSDSRIEQAL